MSAETFRCSECSKSFSTRGRFNQHLRTHSKPFRCEPCQRGFGLRLDLDRHVKAKHRLGLDVLRCPNCHVEFKRKDNLTRHLKAKHKSTTQAEQKVSQNESIEENGSHIEAAATSPAELGSAMLLRNYQLFMQAASTGNLDLLQSLEASVPLQQKAADGSTALHCAARAGQTAVVEYLVKKGVDVSCLNKKRRSPLQEACLGRCPETVLFLMQNASSTLLDRLIRYIVIPGNVELVFSYVNCFGKAFTWKVGWKLLTAAMNFRQTEIVLAILDIDVNGEKMLTKLNLERKLLIAMNFREKEMFKSFLDNSDEDYERLNKFAVVRCMARMDLIDFMQILINHKKCHALTAELAKSGLWLASGYGRTKSVAFLLGQYNSQIGHDMRKYVLEPLHEAIERWHWNVVDILLSYKDYSGFTESIPEEAQEEDKNAVVKVISRLLADPDFQDINSTQYGGSSLLHIAIEKRDHIATRFLLARTDIDVNMRTQWRNHSALHYAAIYENTEAARLLLQHRDIDTTLVDWNGETPLKWARIRKRQEMEEIILSYTGVHESIDAQAASQDQSITYSPETVQVVSQTQDRHNSYCHDDPEEHTEDLEMSDSFESEEDSVADLMEQFDGY